MEIINTLGRRKTAVARVYVQKGNGSITVNDTDYKVAFPTGTLQYIVNQPFAIAKAENQYDIKATITGGGITGQAEALRLGICRALVEMNPEVKTLFKAEGLMTRDPRMVERKKPGQKKARKRFQFSKR